MARPARLVSHLGRVTRRQGMRLPPLGLLALVLACGLGVGACSTTPQPPSQEPRVAASARAPSPPSAPEPTAAAPPSVAPPASDAGEPPPAPYDLASDLGARTLDAKRRLGEDATTAVVGGVFLLASPAGFGGFGASRNLAARALAAFYNDRFGRRPTQAITVFLFGDAPRYAAFCKAAIHEPCISVYGFYWPEERWMVMNAGLGLGTLTHELVHPLVEADFPNAPTWLNEGIASIFEAPTFPKAGEIHGVKNWRLPRLRAALASHATRAKATPRTLFGMADDTFRDSDEALHYALARYFCQWLDERGKLWPFYRAYRDSWATEPSGSAAFERVVGTSPAEAEAPFLAWLSRL